MTEVAVRSLATFLRALAVLALDATSQTAWLRSLGLGEPALVDELATEFDDGYLLLRTFIAEGWLPAASREPIEAVDRVLRALTASDDPAVWDVAALASDPRWQDIRRLAQAALQTIA